MDFRTKKYHSNLSFLLEEGILKLFLKAGADPNAKIVGPGSTFDTHRSRPASVVYLELCFDILDQSPRIRTIYIELLTEFLRLSSVGVLKNVVDEFCAVLDSRDKDELHWNLPFLAEVKNVLQRSLGAQGPKTIEARQSLDKTAERFLPWHLQTPLEVVNSKRRHKNDSGRQRKIQRQA